MIKRLQLAVSVAMLATLALYGFAQRSPMQTIKEDVDVSLKRHEARVVKALGLTPKQKSDYDKLKAKISSDSAQLASMSSVKEEKGLNININLHTGLKKIFSQAQYKKYMEMWEPVDFSGGVNPMASGSPFGGVDEEILTYLKLSPKQWDEYRAFMKEDRIKLGQFQELAKQEPAKAPKFGSDWNRWSRAEMYRILGEDKYYEWVRHWEDVTSSGRRDPGNVRILSGPG